MQLMFPKFFLYCCFLLNVCLSHVHIYTKNKNIEKENNYLHLCVSLKWLLKCSLDVFKVELLTNDVIQMDFPCGQSFIYFTFIICAEERDALQLRIFFGLCVCGNIFSILIFLINYNVKSQLKSI